MPFPEDNLPQFPDGEKVTREELRMLSRAVQRGARYFSDNFHQGGGKLSSSQLQIETFPGIVASVYSGSGGTSKAQYYVTIAITKTGLITTDQWNAEADGVVNDTVIATNQAELDSSGNGLSSNIQTGTRVQVLALWNREDYSGGKLSSKLYIFYSGASSLAIKYGKIRTAWSPGTNAIILQPWSSPFVITSGSSSVATGDPDVTCFIQFPFALPAVGFGASGGDIIAYTLLDGVLDGGGNPAYVLVNPPILPPGTDEFQVLTNAAAGGASNWIADWVKAHT